MFPNYFVEQLFDAGFTEKEIVETLEDDVWAKEMHMKKNKYVSIEEAHTLPEWRNPRGRATVIIDEEALDEEEKDYDNSDEYKELFVPERDVK